jgi:uncharacterized protein YjiS (DUF1127 family)
MRQAAVFIASQTNAAPVWAPLVELILAPVRWWKRRKTIIHLIDLDDHLLCDIGICRDEIREISGLPLGVDAGRILQDRAIRRRSERTNGWRES